MVFIQLLLGTIIATPVWIRWPAKVALVQHCVALLLVLHAVVQLGLSEAASHAMSTKRFCGRSCHYGLMLVAVLFLSNVVAAIVLFLLLKLKRGAAYVPRWAVDYAPGDAVRTLLFRRATFSRINAGVFIVDGASMLPVIVSLLWGTAPSFVSLTQLASGVIAIDMGIHSLEQVRGAGRILNKLPWLRAAACGQLYGLALGLHVVLALNVVFDRRHWQLRPTIWTFLAASVVTEALLVVPVCVVAAFGMYRDALRDLMPARKRL
jgi:hypothetical protein